MHDTSIHTEYIKIIEKIEQYTPHISEIQKQKIYDILLFLYEYDENSFQIRMEIVHFLLNIKPDMHTIVACLFHEVDDIVIPNEIIQEMVCHETFSIIQELKSISHIHYQYPKNAEIIRRYLLSQINDVRVLHIRIAKRIGILSCISRNTKQFSKITIQHSLNAIFFIILPILSYLGLYTLKQIAQDLYFLIINPKEYEKIKTYKEHKKKKNSVFYANTIVDTITHILHKNNIRNPKISQRSKGIFSIYNKIKKKGYSSIHEVKDLFAMRIIVNTVQECYETLSTLHTQYIHEDSDFTDYIAHPKENGYQSIHTILKIGENEYIEIQIRTHEMDNEAEMGGAAHSNYKGEFQIMKNINTSPLSSRDDKFQHVKLSLPKKIYPMTPTGEIKELPIGATPIDFAYSIHSDIGNRCSGAIVNEKIVPLHTPLHSEDMVSILTDKNKYPKKEWLKFVVSSSARHKIKSYLYSIGENVIAKTEKLPSCEKPKKINTEEKQQERERKDKRKEEILIIGGEKNVNYHYAKCCLPEGKDNCIAYASQSREFIIHHKNCPNLTRLDPDRISEVVKFNKKV